MKVVLLKKIKGTGDTGDIKEVADGYALNFLIPQKLAEPATTDNIHKLQKNKAELIKKSSQELILAQKLAQKLTGVVVKIKGKCSSDGKLYSSISASAIADNLKAQGLNINSKQINLLKPIKELGDHSVFIVLDHGLESEITVVVTE